MEVSIITIGDELLIGQVVDTNSAWMGQKLNNEGFSIKRITSISDDADEISKTLDAALQETSIVLITGGLGPTKDDITKYTLAKYFNSKLVHNADVLKNVEQLLLKRLGKIGKLNKSQAMVPEKCKVLINEYGTAPAMWFEQNGKVVVSMAGVPHEMKHSMQHAVLPLLKDKFKVGQVLHKTLLIIGYPESVLSEYIEDIEESLPPEIKLAYLPSPGLVRLRLTARGISSQNLNDILINQTDRLYERLGEAIIGEDDENLEQKIGALLKQKGWMLGTAESCTGGAIASLITSVAGSSAYFAGSIVAYQNEIKHKILGVSNQDLEKYGAVSEPVIRQMVKGTLQTLGCDIAVATSGIAGPTGGTEEKPVGTVWVAVGTKDRIVSRKFVFSRSRTFNIRRSTVTALLMLKELIQSSTV